MKFKPDENVNARKLRSPVNLTSRPAGDDTGFLIVRLREGTTRGEQTDLGKALLEADRIDLDERMSALKLTGSPLIKAIPRERLRKLERDLHPADDTDRSSLSNYWRINTRNSPENLGQIEQRLKQLPEVELVYREKVVTDPVNPDNDSFYPLQKYLGEEGVNAESLWSSIVPGSVALHFIDLEQAWIRNHEDLPTTDLIYNDNRDGHDITGDHGSAVIGIVAGVDNAKGVIGIEPNPAKVRLVSHWDRETGDMVVADAIVAASTNPPIPHVLLIEAQTGESMLPVEAESASFNAIQLATNAGVVVVEAAGNGNQNLAGLLPPGSSGAILVGAGDAEPPHNRGLWKDGQGSNYGQRVKCYAWGNGITTAGYGDLQLLEATKNYTGNFGGTSGAAAIIAGCALLLQRLSLQATGYQLTPLEMRNLLTNPATGTPHGNAVEGKIGVMPNLRAIVQANPNLFPGII